MDTIINSVEQRGENLSYALSVMLNMGFFCGRAADIITFSHSNLSEQSQNNNKHID